MSLLYSYLMLPIFFFDLHNLLLLLIYVKDVSCAIAHNDALWYGRSKADFVIVNVYSYR